MRVVGGRYANQWDNLANARSHIESSGPEILQQTGAFLIRACVYARTRACTEPALMRARACGLADRR